MQDLLYHALQPHCFVIRVPVAVVPPLFFGEDWEMCITLAIVFIVAAAPCGLVISIPITLVASLGTGARHGVLIKGGVYIEELARVRQSLFWMMSSIPGD